jgi:ABC-2 type transport system permease protein
MKTAFRILRLELSTLFYSPIAWLVLVIFVFQSGVSFADIFDLFTKILKLGSKQEEYTNLIFANPGFGFFPGVVKNLYLYIPLLTMGLMSRELQSGSIKLLFSSPIKIRDIVLGKFMAMSAYGLTLILILVCFVITGALSISHMDTSQVISGLLGIYLLICAYAAIGLFMSCLTSYQVVAAISTLAVFAVLNFIDQVGQKIEFVRDITYFLSISGRTSEFISGLVKTSDVFYFLIIIVIFLGLSYLKLLHGRESRHGLVKILRYCFFIGAMLLFGYLTSLPSWTGYLDMTAGNRRTLADSSRQIIRKMDRPLHITGYVNILDDNAYMGMPIEWNNNKSIFEKYTRFKPDIKISYVYYYDSVRSDYLYAYNPGLTIRQIAKKNAEAYDLKFENILSPGQIKEQIDLSGEEHRFAWLLEYDGRKSFARNFRDQQKVPAESEITASLKQLIDMPARIGFLRGHQERNIDQSGDKDYKIILHDLTFRYSLINQGLVYDTLDLVRHEIPADLMALVIADPETTLNKDETDKIERFIDRGGNLLIAGKPSRQLVLNPLLQYVGAKFINGTVIQSIESFPADFILSQFNKPSTRDSSSYYFFFRKNENEKVSFPGSMGITFSDTGRFRHFPVMITKLPAWIRQGNAVTDSSRAGFISALGITRQLAGKEQRIMVVGSADFMDNIEIMRQNIKTANLAFIHDIFRWLSYGEYPPDTRHPDAKDNDLRIGQPQVLWLRIFFLGVFPLMIIFMGSILLIRRRKK